MTTCDNCGTLILFGGEKDGDFRFCGKSCREAGRSQSQILNVAEEIPQDMLSEYVTELHQGACPRCGGSGPVDVQTSHMIWSILLFTSFNSHPELCCASCGIKKKMLALLSCTLLGWWGFPFGIIITPIQIALNLWELRATPDPETPSDELVKMARIQLAAEVLQHEQVPQDEQSQEEGTARDNPVTHQ